MTISSALRDLPPSVVSDYVDAVSIAVWRLVLESVSGIVLCVHLRVVVCVAVPIMGRYRTHIVRVLVIRNGVC